MRRALAATAGKSESTGGEDGSDGDGDGENRLNDTNATKEKIKKEEDEDEEQGEHLLDDDDGDLIVRIGVLTEGFTGADMTLLVRR